MRPYIYGKRNLIHIIDLRETVKGLIRATRLLSRVAAQGSLILFVGTKRQAQEAVAREASRVWMPFVSERWIGGTFTNFRTIRDRLHRLQELERLMETGEITSYSKKCRSTLLREMKKIHRNLAGIRTMNRPPGAARHRRSAQRSQRRQGSPRRRHSHRRAHRHRQRSRPRRPCDPRQRRQHPLDRPGVEDHL